MKCKIKPQYEAAIDVASILYLCAANDIVEVAMKNLVHIIGAAYNKDCDTVMEDIFINLDHAEAAELANVTEGMTKQ